MRFGPRERRGRHRPRRHIGWSGRQQRRTLHLRNPAGRRGATYVPTAQGLGKTVRVEATGTRGAGWTPATALSTPTETVAAAPVVVAPVPTLVSKRLPRIKGTLRVGRVVRVTTGAWTPYPKKLTFRWHAGKRAITGVTRERLTLTKKQVGKRLRVVVTASAPKHEPLAVTTKRTDKVRR